MLVPTNFNHNTGAVWLFISNTILWLIWVINLGAGEKKPNIGVKTFQQ